MLVSVREGESKEITHQGVTIPDDWNLQQLSVIAFVYTDTGVQQVAKLKLAN